MYTEGSRGTLVNAGQPRRIVGGGEGRGERNGEDNSRTITDSILLARTREYSTDINDNGISLWRANATDRLHANKSFKSNLLCRVLKINPWLSHNFLLGIRLKNIANRKFIFHLGKSFHGTKRATIKSRVFFQRFLEINISKNLPKRLLQIIKLIHFVKLVSKLHSSQFSTSSLSYFFCLRIILSSSKCYNTPCYLIKDRIVIVVNQDVRIRGALNIHKYKARNTGLDLESSQVQLGSTIQLASWNSVLDVTRRYTIQIDRGNTSPSIRKGESQRRKENEKIITKRIFKYPILESIEQIRTDSGKKTDKRKDRHFNLNRYA